MLQIGKWVECKDGRFVNLDHVMCIDAGHDCVNLYIQTGTGITGATLFTIETKTPESLTRTILRSLSDKRFSDGEKT